MLRQVLGAILRPRLGARHGDRSERTTEQLDGEKLKPEMFAPARLASHKRTSREQLAAAQAN